MEAHAFLDDMAQRFADADLIVCRSGASTVAEIAAAGKCALFVPFPGAADDHQLRNAELLAQAGAALLTDKIKAGERNHDIIGGLDLMATFAAVAGVKLPTEDREGKPTIFDSYDLSPVFFGTGACPRYEWYYFTEDELLPGAIRVGNFKMVFNLRGDNGAPTGGLAVDTNLGWKGGEKYIATVPQIFDLWQDPQERYDIFMTKFHRAHVAWPSHVAGV